MATRNLAALLERFCSLARLDLNRGDDDFVHSTVRFRLSVVLHFLRMRRRVKKQLVSDPAAPVIWTTVSPTPLGHFRDMVTVVPALTPTRVAIGVVHRGNFHRVFGRPDTAWTARLLRRRVTSFVFTSEGLSERCSRWLPPGQRHVIPNTIDDELICTAQEIALKRARREAGGPLRLLFLSDMIPSKGYLDVLAAVKGLAAATHAVEATFAGRWESDSARHSFESYVRDQGLTGVVTHHGGIQDRLRVRALHAEADVLLLPTYYPSEAQPLVVIEALAAGTPVIVTHHASLPEMVREGREALFVPARSSESIVAAVQRLLSLEPWRRLSEGARRRFDERFSPDVVRHRWLSLIDEARPKASREPGSRIRRS